MHSYARVFATSMKNKWKHRVYIDLFAGSGRSRIEGTNEIIRASPLLALEVPDRFDRYIFCEENRELMAALQKRIARDYPGVEPKFIPGDSNVLVEDILDALPKHSGQSKVLSFCFADPFKLKNLHFSTIERLAQHFMDFLILIPTHMDAGRNVARYMRPDNRTVDEFIGSSAWRQLWQDAKGRGETFDSFLTTHYAKRMKELGYRDRAAEETKLIRSKDRNLPLYRLAFFSRHQLGEQFWREAKKYSDPQGLFDFGSAT